MYRILRERQSDEREDGFTLIELLVVVIIIGILAAIAIPVFLNQRERAWNSAVESDSRNAAVAMEAWYSDNGDYEVPLSTADPNLTDVGLTTSDSVELRFYTEGGNHQQYCIEGYHANLGGTTTPVAVYSSTDGGFVEVADCSAVAGIVTPEIATYGDAS